MYVCRAYGLLCISNALISCCRISNTTEHCIVFYNIPNVGMKRSLGGNGVFPRWEQIVPLLGMFLTCFNVGFDTL